MKTKAARTHPAQAKPLQRAPVRLLVCDDQRFVRTLVRQMLRQIHAVEIVGEADGGKSVVSLAHELRPDVVLMDVSMPDLDGIEATRQIVLRSPATRILAHSSDLSPQRVESMMAAGAHGFLLKTGDPNELMTAVATVLAGERFVSARTAGPQLKHRRD